MAILHLQPGRYLIKRIEYEGERRTHFYFNLSPQHHFYFTVKPACANYAGSLVISANWNAVLATPLNHEKFPVSYSIEPTAQRDTKWAMDVVPGMAGVRSVESLLEKE